MARHSHAWNTLHTIWQEKIEGYCTDQEFHTIGTSTYEIQKFRSFRRAFIRTKQVFHPPDEWMRFPNNVCTSHKSQDMKKSLKIRALRMEKTFIMTMENREEVNTKVKESLNLSLKPVTWDYTSKARPSAIWETHSSLKLAHSNNKRPTSTTLWAQCPWSFNNQITASTT